jgi:hypothetical protein
VAGRSCTPQSEDFASAHDVDKDRFQRQILSYATIVVVVGPLLAWLVFVVVPGWF